MRILQIIEKTAPISSPISNAYIDFSKMTCSVVAVVTDVVKDGGVIGYGFNSNGRYGQGCLIRERFRQRAGTTARERGSKNCATRCADIWTAATTL
jgi:D(-)-tartrate dehydratase